MCLYVCKDTVKGICFKESNYSALNWLQLKLLGRLFLARLMKG